MRHFRCTALRRFIKTFQFSPLPRIMYQKSPKYILRCFLFVYSLRKREGTAFRNSLCQAHFRPLGGVCPPCPESVAHLSSSHGVWAVHLSGASFRRCCHGALEGQSGPGDRSLGGNRGGHRQGVGPSRYEGGGLRSGRGESEGVWRRVFTRLAVFDAL